MQPQDRFLCFAEESKPSEILRLLLGQGLGISYFIYNLLLLYQLSYFHNATGRDKC